MRRITLIILLIGLSAAVAFAAGQGEESEEITLTVWDFKYGEVDGAQPVFKEIDEQFMEKYPNVTVEHVAQPGGADYRNLLSSAAASQSGPDVAIIVPNQNYWAYEEVFVDLNEYVEPWQDEINDLSWDAVSPSGSWEDGIKAVPITVQGFGMYYNKTLFEEAGLDPDDPPRDLEDFYAAIEQLQDAGITAFVDGWQPHPKSVQYLSRAWTVNDYSTEEAKGFATGDSNFDDPEFVRVLEVFKEMRERGYYAEESQGMDYWNDARAAFRNGEGAIFFGLLSDIAHWKEFSDALGKNNVGFFPSVNIPGQEMRNRVAYQPAGLGWSVFNWSDHKEMAAEYAGFYAREGARLMLEDLGALVPNNSVDVSQVDYPVLEEITGYTNDNGVRTYAQFVPGTALNAQSMELASAWFSGAITFEEYIQQSQDALERALEN